MSTSGTHVQEEESYKRSTCFSNGVSGQSDEVGCPLVTIFFSGMYFEPAPCRSIALLVIVVDCATMRMLSFVVVVRCACSVVHFEHAQSSR